MNVSTAGSGRPSSAQTVRTASISAGGPQTNVAAAAWSEITAEQVLAGEAPAELRLALHG